MIYESGMYHYKFIRTSHIARGLGDFKNNNLATYGLDFIPEGINETL